MVKGISAVDSIFGTAKKQIKKTTKNVAQKISDNKVEIMATGALAGGVGLYAHQFAKFVNRKDEALDTAAQADDAGFFEKVTDKIKEKFTIDLEHVPEGVNPADKYITDIDGNILYSDITCLPYPNPWYNPELAMQQIENSQNAATALLTPNVSMESFLQKAGEHGSDVIDAAAGAVHFGDNISADDLADTVSDTATSILDYVKEVVDHISDFI